MSGLTLGINPNEYRYIVDIGGRADGPSAGALMTIGGVPHTIDGTAQAKEIIGLGVNLGADPVGPVIPMRAPSSTPSRATGRPRLAAR